MRLALVLVCALAGTAIAGDDDPLARARAAAEDLRFEEAARLLDQAWRAGTDDPLRARAIAALAGEISATMGDRGAALRWFALLAARDPDAALDRGTSPKVNAILEEARAGLHGGHLDVALRFDHARRLVHLRPVDPLGAVAEIRLRGGPAGRRDLAIPWRRAALAIDLIDAHGNVLFSTRRAIAPMPAAPAAAIAASPARLSWYARWPTWAGVAGGLAVTAGGLALWSAATSRELESLHRESETHQASEALALERRMQRTAIAAEIAGAGAAVAAAVAVVSWRRERSATVAPMAIEGAGVGAAFEVSF
jgi:hypothetical protein